MSRGWVRAACASVALIPLLLVASTADAVEAGFYAGGNYGKTRMDLDIGVFDTYSQAVYSDAAFIVSDSASSLEKADTTYSFFGGYRFSRHWAVEAGYIDFGKSVYREQSTGSFLQDDGTLAEPESHAQRWTVKSRAMAVSGLGILPLSYRSEVYVRAGLLYTNNDLSASVDNLRLGQLSDSGSSWIAGVGGSFTFADIYAVRLEFQRAFDVGSSDWQKSDVDMVTLGLAVTF